MEELDATQLACASLVMYLPNQWDKAAGCHVVMVSLTLTLKSVMVGVRSSFFFLLILLLELDLT